MKRRAFIKNSTLASTALWVPSFLKPFEKASTPALAHKVLVVIQLSGGNDGLNTVVPYGNDLYYQKRPSLAIPKNEVIRLNDMQGLNPAMKALREVHDQGWMNIINDVGYPNPDRSHFRSMDIWHTGSDAGQYLSTGWIGRYLDSECAACKSPHNAIEAGEALSLALKGKSKKGIAVTNPAQLYRTTREPFFNEMAEVAGQEHLSEDNLGYLYKTMIETYSSAEYIQENSRAYKNRAEYPASPFSNQLKLIARFINSGLNTRVYYVSLSGFDTHVGQAGRQERLLKMYAEGLSAFLKDLKKQGNLDNTLVMTFSEFGRRVEQNASNGTDHGTANNLFLFGGKLKKPGIFNAAPDLGDLRNGDLKFKVDFRNVYASLLDKWLEVSDTAVLNKKFAKIGLV